MTSALSRRHIGGGALVAAFVTRVLPSRVQPNLSATVSEAGCLVARHPIMRRRQGTSRHFAVRCSQFLNRVGASECLIPQPGANHAGIGQIERWIRSSEFDLTIENVTTFDKQ